MSNPSTPPLALGKMDYVRLQAAIKGLSLAEVRRRARVKPPMFSQWLKNVKSSAPIERRVARIVGCRVGELRKRREP